MGPVRGASELEPTRIGHGRSNVVQLDRIEVDDWQRGSGDVLLDHELVFERRRKRT